MFPGGSTPGNSICTFLNLVDDFSVEGNESFVVIAGGAHFFPNRQTTVIIQDDDSENTIEYRPQSS